MSKWIIRIILILFLFGILIGLDWNDRFSTDLPEYYSNEESQFLTHYKTVEESQKVIEENWNDEKYQFPKEKISCIKVCKNVPLIGRIIGRELNTIERKELIEIINDFENFDWGETTWGIHEASHIFRFLDIQEKEIMKIWVCLDDCKMIEIKPWIPSTKYGGLNEKGYKKMEKLLAEF